MSFFFVCLANQINELDPVFIEINGAKIAIYKFNGNFYAYENECAHEGGPVAEGRIIGNLECDVSENGRVLGEHFSSTKMNIACPWHGVQYDLKTGVSNGNARLRLAKYDVVLDGDEVKVRV